MDNIEIGALCIIMIFVGAISIIVLYKTTTPAYVIADMMCSENFGENYSMNTWSKYAIVCKEDKISTVVIKDNSHTLKIGGGG